MDTGDDWGQLTGLRHLWAEGVSLDYRLGVDANTLGGGGAVHNRRQGER